MDYYYKVYGLKIISELEFPKVDTWSEQDDSDCFIDNGVICIRQGTVEPKYKEEILSKNKKHILGQEITILHYAGEAFFSINNGNEIIAELYPECNMENVRALILSNCLGLIMVQKGIIAIHGGAVVRRNKAIAVTGTSGSGKSTLCNALRQSGLKFLADDTVSVKMDEKTGIPMAYPGYPFTKLCKDTAISYGYDIDKLELIQECRGKYAVDLRDEFYDKPITLGAVVMVKVDSGKEVTIEEITGSYKLQFITDALYSYRAYGELGMNPQFLMQEIAIANQVPFYLIKRPDGIMTTDRQMELLFEQLDKKYRIF